MEILLFNTRDELLRVSLKHVVYFEADGNYTHIHFTNGVEKPQLFAPRGQVLLTPCGKI